MKARSYYANVYDVMRQMCRIGTSIHFNQFASIPIPVPFLSFLKGISRYRKSRRAKT
jgi:hypothetical protein